MLKDAEDDENVRCLVALFRVAYARERADYEAWYAEYLSPDGSPAALRRAEELNYIYLDSRERTVAAEAMLLNYLRENPEFAARNLTYANITSIPTGLAGR